MNITDYQYFYHLTQKVNVDSICQHGLQPRLPKRFASLSPEANDKRPKIYWLPILNGFGMRGFLEEWWHGDTADIIVLRCALAPDKVLRSQDPYYAKQECWTYDVVDASCLQIKPLRDKKWSPLK